jgi:hypothetical protein
MAKYASEDFDLSTFNIYLDYAGRPKNRFAHCLVQWHALDGAFLDESSGMFRGSGVHNGAGTEIGIVMPINCNGPSCINNRYVVRNNIGELIPDQIRFE